MFEVICIDDKPKGTPQAPWLIQVGITYTVIQVIDAYDTKYYELSEHTGVAYESIFFAPLSDIDETEFIRHYQTETV